MVYIASVNDQTYTIDTHTDDGQHHVVLNGTPHTVDWQRIAPLAGTMSEGGYFSLIIAGVSYEIFARCITRTDYEITFGGQSFVVTVEDERAQTLAGVVRSTATTDEAQVHAPMPGLVVAVPLEQGVTVSQGQTVIVLEAMKMENDLASPIDGVIKEVRVQKGQTVNQGEVLVVIGTSSFPIRSG